MLLYCLQYIFYRISTAVNIGNDRAMLFFPGFRKFYPEIFADNCTCRQ